MKEIEDNWEDMRFENTTKSFDERIVLKIWRFCKIHYELIVGLIIGIMVTTLALR